MLLGEVFAAKQNFRNNNWVLQYAE